jgi:hypothetical protein
MRIEPLLDGRFVRLDYTWMYQGRPQSGSLLVGHRTKAGVLTGHWIDSWHNSESVMPLEGKSGDAAALVMRGSYPAPPGPDWDWRIAITPDTNQLEIIMHNIFPEGKEEPAVEATYSRVTTGRSADAR